VASFSVTVLQGTTHAHQFYLAIRPWPLASQTPTIHQVSSRSSSVCQITRSYHQSVSAITRKNVIMQTVAQSEGKAEVSGWGGSNGREILNWWTVCRLHDINSQNGACTSRHCVRWVTNNDVCCYAAPPRWVILQNGAVRLSVCLSRVWVHKFCRMGTRINFKVEANVSSSCRVYKLTHPLNKCRRWTGTLN